MNLNKFRDIKPDEKAMKDLLDKISENDAEYIEKLQKLKYKKSNNGKIIQIVSAVAAAVVLVAAFSLWALLGRGIRIIGDTPGAPDDEINYNIYTVTVSHDGKLIDGKDMLQGFFDDYVSGRMCTLEMVHMDRPGNYEGLEQGEVPPSYVATFVCRENGTVLYKLDQPTGTYGLIEFAFNEQEFDSMKLILDRAQNKYFAQFVSYDGMQIDTPLNLDIITNSHENSVRVYDSEKALPVTVENGRVISGENTISDFFESYIKGHYVSAEINGRTYLYKGKKEGFEIYENGEETEFSRNYGGTADISIINNDYSVGLGIMWFGFAADNSSRETVVELDYDEIKRLGILYNSADIILYNISATVSKGVSKDIAELLTRELKENPPEELKMLPRDNPDYCLKLNDYVKIYAYKDDNGGILDDFSIEYSFGNKMAVRISDNFIKLVLDLVSDDDSADVPSVTKEQRLKYYDFAGEYRIDYMPDFKEDDELTVSDLRWNIYAYLDFPESLSGDAFSKAASKLYGLDFDLDENYNVPIEIGSYNPNTYMELVFYEYDKQSNIVTVQLDEYDGYEEGYVGSMPALEEAVKKSGKSAEEFIRTAVGNGSMGSYGEPKCRYIVTYLSSDGVTPERFTGKTTYYKSDDGAWRSNDETLKIYAERAFCKYIEGIGGLEDYRILVIKVSQYSDPDERSQYQVSVTYSVKPKSDALGLGYDWIAGNGVMGDDGWIIDKYAVCYANVYNGEMVLNSVGTGP